LVKITYTPYTEIVVHEIIERDNQSFFEDMVRQTLAGQVHAEPSVNWIDGVAFAISPMPPTEDIIKENLGGKVHYAAVLFTRMDYKNQFIVRLGNQDYNVRLRKADDNPTMTELSHFLKSFTGAA
jgi:hypothetical protein